MPTLIKQARDKGISDDKILLHIKQNYPSFSDKIDKATSAGIQSSAILNRLNIINFDKQKPSTTSQTTERIKSGEGLLSLEKRPGEEREQQKPTGILEQGLAPFLLKQRKAERQIIPEAAQKDDYPILTPQEDAAKYDEFKTKFPDFADQFDTYQKAGLPIQLAVTDFVQNPKLKTKPKNSGEVDRLVSALDRRIKAPFIEGLQESASGVLTGNYPSFDELQRREHRDTDDLTSFIKGIGTLAGDVPIMTGAGVATSLVTANPIVGGITSFASAALLKSAMREYTIVRGLNPQLDHLTFDQMVEIAPKIATETSVAGLTGAMVALNPFLAGFKKLPGAQKLLSTAAGKTIIPFATELASLQSVSSVVAGEFPTVKDLAASSITLTGFKFARGESQKILQAAKNIKMRPNIFMETIKGFTKAELEAIGNAKNLKTVEAILAKKGVTNSNIKVKPVVPEKVPSKAATPFGRVLDKLSIQQAKPAIQKTKEWFQKIFRPDKLKEDYLDDVFIGKRIVANIAGIKPVEVENLNIPQNFYKSLRNFKGYVEKGDIFLQHQTFSAKSGKALAKKGKPLGEILQRAKTNKELAEFDVYAVSKRALEKNKQGFKTGITNEDATANVKDLHKKYEPMRKEFIQYRDDLLDYVKDSGLLNDKSTKQMKGKNKDYVPFYRVFEQDLQGSLPISKGKIKTVKGIKGTKGLQSKQPIKKFKGEGEKPLDILDPIESSVRDTYIMIQLADKNRIGQQLVKLSMLNSEGQKFVQKIRNPLSKTKVSKKELIQKIKSKAKKEDRVLEDDFLDALNKEMPEQMEIFRSSSFTPAPNTISVWFDGKRQFFKVAPEVFKLFNETLTPKETSLLVKIFATPARTLRAGAILNPKFLVKNPIRDWIGGALFTKANLNPFYDPLAGLADSIGATDTYVEWLKAGGGMSTMQSLDRPSVAKKLNDIRSSVSGADFRKIKSFGDLAKVSGKLVKQTARHPLQKGLRALAQISEEANRLAEFRAAIRKFPNTREGKEWAAFASRDVSIDFAKIGLKTSALNKLSSFWNVTLQGSDKIIRTMAQNPRAYSEFGLRVAAGLVIPTLMLELANEGDKEIEELTDQEKDFNFIFKVGDEIKKIPVPFDTGYIAHGFTRRYYQYMKGNNPRAFEGFARTFLEGVMPSTLITAVEPFIETFANKDKFTGRRIIPRRLEDKISELQVKGSTSETAKLLAKAFGYMPLIDELESKWTSPAVIQHFMDSWTAGLGRVATNIIDEGLVRSGIVEKGIPKPEVSLLSKLGLNAFEVRFPRSNSASIERFYDNYFRAKKLQSSTKLLLSQGDKERAKEINDLNTIPKMDVAYEAMQQAQQFINKVYKDPKMSPKMKRQILDRQYREMINFARNANEQMDKFIKKRDDKKQLFKDFPEFKGQINKALQKGIPASKIRDRLEEVGRRE